MRPRVVIAGAGFGGLTCARALKHALVDVLLVDRNNYHLFTPLLYQVASALLDPGEIARPVRELVRPLREQVVVVAVDEQHVDVDAFQRAGACDPAESGAGDDDAWSACQLSGYSRPFSVRSMRPVRPFCGGNRPPPMLRRRLAIFSTAGAPPVSCSSERGSFCFFFTTGSNRSPSFATRASTWSESNTSVEGSPVFKHFSTSAHVTGVDTVGRARARSE